MADDKNLKKQRDQFLAFAFASADLFIEIGEDDKVSFALGAARGLTGINDNELIGKNWLDMFAVQDQTTLTNIRNRSKPGMRQGPIIVQLSEKMDSKKAIVTAIKMPKDPKFYLTLGVGTAMMNKIARALIDPPPGELHSSDTFTDAAKDALDAAKSMEQDVDITLLDIATNEKDRERIGEEGWSNLTESIRQLLISESVDGQAAAEISEGRYSVLHDAGIDADFFQKKIAAIAEASDPSGEGIDVKSKTVSADVKTLSERDASRAIVYTIREFERKGTELTIENLNSGFDSYVAANAEKIKEFQSFIERLSFSLHFQPIVNLETLEASHYEMLCRFEEGNTQEWVMFGEDIGMASEFDLAVCERAINYINYKGGVIDAKFSLNLSGQSMEDEGFLEKLMEKLNKNKLLAKRLMFEITESTQIENLDKVNEFIAKLQDAGFKVALDDFGAGSASFQYLQSLHVDYVKIDGKYIRKLLSSQRDAAMVKNLARMCKDLGIAVIAEFVEDQDQVEALKTMGIEYGQGYFFGKPESKPDYQSPKS